jgi:hypothetical protein
MLDVKMTMANLSGTHVDGSYDAQHPPQTSPDPNNPGLEIGHVMS